VPTSAKGTSGFAGVEVTHLAVDAGKGADQIEARALAVEVLKQGDDGLLAVIQRDVVEIIENPCFLQFAQFGIDIAAAERNDDGRVVRLDRLRDAEGGIDGTGEGHGNQHQIRFVAVDGRNGQIF
jgi:hypothetical protein